MSFELVLSTVVAWSAQVFVLVAAAACIAITIAHPKGRLLFWQGVLLLAVVIPIVEPWKPAAPILLVAPTYGYGIVVGAAAAPAPSPLVSWRREDWLLILAIGAALRLIWIATGFARLRAYRMRARQLTDLPLPFVSALWFKSGARWYASEDVPGPVTYGWLRPSILLPTRVLALPAALREPIACHELLHVKRLDWLFVLA
jgi:beta-lactamase regulating signal transducer with metallopeptidase domain